MFKLHRIGHTNQWVKNMKSGDKVWYGNYVGEIVFDYGNGCTIKFKRGNNIVHRYCFYEDLEPFLQLSFMQ